MHVLFLPAYSPKQLEMASSRQRLYQFLPRLRELGISVSLVVPPVGTAFQKVIYYWRVLLNASRADVIFIQKKLFPISWLELIRRRNPNLIFDLDDALFVPNPGAPNEYHRQNALRERLNWILAHARHVVVCNNFLAEYARTLNDRVSIVPTCVDTAFFYPREISQVPRRQRLVLGWTGSGEQHLHHLELLKKPLEQLARELPLELRLVGTMNSGKIRQAFAGCAYPVLFVDWIDPDALPEALAQFDIGLMPLVEDAWSCGKCGFKALLYMAMGLATLASPVGMNREIIHDGENGFLPADESEWVERVRQLYNQPGLSAQLGANAVATVRKHYSVDTWTPKLAKILQSV